MAHFAKLDENNIVTKVVAVANNKTGGGALSQESVGIAFLQGLYGADTVWKQTSYNGNFRGNFAGIGHTYMTNVAALGVASTDIFIRQRPIIENPGNGAGSWTISSGISSTKWVAPLGDNPCVGLTSADHQAGKYYYWNEKEYQADAGNPKTVGWALTTI